MTKMKPFEKGRLLGEWESYYNGRFQVLKRDSEEYVTLSIRREDRKHIMDWRDVQWIKNQLLGPEVEAVQLFPAESRLVDTSNQYYLFAPKPLGQKFSFGFQNRMVVENLQIGISLPGFGLSQQRPFAEHVKPADMKEQEAYAANEARQLAEELNRQFVRVVDNQGKGQTSND